MGKGGGKRVSGGMKRRSHAKGASKGQRWAKGQSCESNPTSKKYRSLAQVNFLHPIADNPLFTVRNVEAMAVAPERDGNNMEEDLTSEVDSLTISDVSCGTGMNSFSTLNSLSSSWSKCSTNAFDRFLQRFRSSSLVQKEMLGILAASSDVIDGAGGKLNTTGYFATFLSLLDTCPPDQYQPVMSLLCIITPRVSDAVLQKRFTDIYPKIALILQHASSTSNDLLIRTCLEALMKVLKVQEDITTLLSAEASPLHSLFLQILKFSLHEKPRVRKKARICIKRLVVRLNATSNAVTKLIVGWILDQLSLFPTQDAKSCADVLTLLLSIWTSITTLSKPALKKLFEGVLRVLSSTDQNIMKIGFNFFTLVFENNVTVSQSDPEDELFSKVIVAIWELQPDTRNSEPFFLWYQCILAAICRLNLGPRRDFDIGPYLAPALETSSPLWITTVGRKIFLLSREYWPHIITKSTPEPVISKIFRTISKNLLTVPPNPLALEILEAYLDALSPTHYCTAAQDLFLQLVPLRHSAGVHPVMGKFVKAFGAESLWLEMDKSTRWLVILPLLQDNLSNAEILFWKKNILPVMGTQGRLDQGWASLIGFCRNPKDPENFPAQLLGQVIVEKNQVRLPALGALRQFVEWPQCKNICQKYSKNYLPILFNLYIKTKPEMEQFPGHCDAVGQTIQKYLEHCEPDFIKELTEKALTKFLKEVDEAGSPVFDLLAYLGVHVKEVDLQDKILDGTVKKWVKIGDSKRAYRILSSLAKNKELDKNVMEKLIETLKKTKAETKSNAAALRIECISTITELNPELLKDFITEVVINLFSANAKAKKLSAEYVTRFCQHIKATKKDVSTTFEMIRVGLMSPIPLMVSCTLRFLFMVYMNLAPENPSFELLEMCISRVLNHQDPNVWKHSLQFIILNMRMYQGKMGPLATQLGQIVAESKFPAREIKRLLARMIKVFGVLGVKAVVPNGESPKMRNRIRNICRKLREGKKKNEDNNEVEIQRDEEDDAVGELGGDESEEEEGMIDFDGRRRGRMDNNRLVMKEGVVDFLNPSDLAKSFINEKPAKKAEPFKISKDGKLIIDVEDPKSRKRGAPADDSSSDSDEDDDNQQDDGSDDDGDEPVAGPSKKKSLGKSNMSAKSVRSSGSKFSMRSWKSAKSGKSMKSGRSGGGGGAKPKAIAGPSSSSAAAGPSSAVAGSFKVKTKGIRRDLSGGKGGNGKKNGNKRFKSSGSQTGKSRKSSAASSFRLKM